MSNIENTFKGLREPEEPEFIIERDDEDVVIPTKPAPTPAQLMRRRWLYRLLKAIALFVLFFLAFYAYNQWSYYHPNVPISTQPEENIQKLSQPAKEEPAEVVMTSDSILGVALDFYALHGLRAAIEMEEPDTADTDVYLYCRSADHKPDKTYHGSLVAKGKELEKKDLTRLGYMAMTNGNAVIGISRSDKVKDYVKEQGGSYFRQFMLVSNGTIPNHYYLRGKVERRAIGRKGERLYYIATRHPETLWDFSDALSEYGFIDAIYITGGKDYCFYRTLDGQRHDIGDPEDYPHKKWKGVIPWLVFRK